MFFSLLFLAFFFPFFHIFTVFFFFHCCFVVDSLPSYFYFYLNLHSNDWCVAFGSIYWYKCLTTSHKFGSREKYVCEINLCAWHGRKNDGVLSRVADPAWEDPRTRSNHPDFLSLWFFSFIFKKQAFFICVFKIIFITNFNSEKNT